MPDKLISNAGAGRAFFLTRMKLNVHAVSMSLWGRALPGLIIPFVVWLTCLSPQVRREFGRWRRLEGSAARRYQLHCHLP